MDNTVLRSEIVVDYVGYAVLCLRDIIHWIWIWFGLNSCIYLDLCAFSSAALKYTKIDIFREV